MPIFHSLSSADDKTGFIAMSTIKYRYKFTFANGRVERFNIQLDAKTLTPQKKLPDSLPAWTRLDFKQCPGCPLDPKDEPYCPAAAHMEELVRKMQNVVSIDDVAVKVRIGERIVFTQTSAQEGLSSLLGLITATSGCPFTAFFKPMARFHQPFSSSEETFFRATSTYMLGQYYRWQNDKSADLHLLGLHQFYEKVARVNRGLTERLRAEQREDSALNAVVLLDMMSTGISILLDETLADLEPLFQAYIDAPHVT